MMGFDLSNSKGTYVRLSPTGWSLALVLAENNGWQPEGTTLPPSDEDPPDFVWSGIYGSNDGQLVSASDAQALGDACQRAIDDAGFVAQALHFLELINDVIRQHSPGSHPESATAADMAEFRDNLTELIALCREGSFVIE